MESSSMFINEDDEELYDSHEEIISEIEIDDVIVDKAMPLFKAATEAAAATESMNENIENETIWIQLMNEISTIDYVFYSKVILAFTAAFISSLLFIQTLRNNTKKIKNTYQLTLLTFFIPIMFYFILTIISSFNICDQLLCDAFIFGFFSGILIKIMSLPKDNGFIKIIIQQLLSESFELRFNSINLTIGEIRESIASYLKIEKERIKIESGRGYYIDDDSKPFFEIVDESYKAMDFFGFLTSTCYITIEEKDDDDDLDHEIELIGDDGIIRKKKVRHNPFASLLQSKARYGDNYHLHAKSLITRANYEVKPFHIASIDKFAAAAPGHAPLFSKVRILAWSANNEIITDSLQSEAMEKESMVSNVPKSTGILSLFSHRRPDEHSSHGRPIHNGDKIIIESGGKFLSVARGWWIAWVSEEPRYSGAFEVELIERTQYNTIKESLQKIKNKRRESISRSHLERQSSVDAGIEVNGHHGIVSNGSILTSPAGGGGAAAGGTAGGGDIHDSIIRPGDWFRLRSVKYPDYELGITSINLKDEYYNLGLRKIGTNDADEDAWCMSVLYSLKSVVIKVPN